MVRYSCFSYKDIRQIVSGLCSLVASYDIVLEDNVATKIASEDNVAANCCSCVVCNQMWYCGSSGAGEKCPDESLHG